MARLVLEIGTEELPSRFLAAEQADSARMLEAELDEASLAHGEIMALATPRRLTLIVEDLADSQPVREEIVTGPPVRAAYGPDGAPAKALTAFARGQGVAIEDVFRMHTDRGEYVACRRKTGGKNALEVLANMAPAVISRLPFAKRMRWGDNDFAYARPIRWLLAMLDDTVVPFEVAGVRSGNRIQGHRVHGMGFVTVPHAKDYEKVTAGQCGIVLDPDRRRDRIRQKGDELAKQAGGAIVWKDSLLDEVCGLVEQPVPILGGFDRVYLEIPEEVLLTSMETHQKSFGVRGNDGKLLPHFLTVLNLKPEDPDLVRNGWEKVLRARLEDARFFWNADRATRIDSWLEKLEHVIFIGQLGSMADKCRRLEKLSLWLGEQVSPADSQIACQAAKIAKADLVSGMVGEFDTLQGIMGGIYAREAGMDQAVAAAIAGQYLPAGPDSPLPATAAGAILAVADKADTLAGCFGLNMIPGGAADPNGLRRCALGIIRILLDRQWDLDVDLLFAHALELYGDIKWRLEPSEALSRLHEFFAGRLRFWFMSSGHDTMQVDAVLASGSSRVADCQARLDALSAFMDSPDYQKSAQVLKRIENIGKKCDKSCEEWTGDRLVEDAEIALAKALRTNLPVLDRMLEQGDYKGALEMLEKLRQPVDVFFDQVMVMCEEPGLRNNRLGLLSSIGNRYRRIAEFSALSI